MTGKKHHNNWEQAWLEGEITHREAKQHAENDPQFESLQKFVEQSGNLCVRETISQEEAWKKLESKISNHDSPKVISISRRNWIIGVAASFILAIGAFFILQPRTNQVSIATGLAEVRTVNLPDGSVAYLNAESSVSFPEKGWTDHREVRLTGEAFFEVKRGSSFKVLTTNGKIEVLGTSFNVRTRGQLLQVACKTGKVKVSSPEGTSEQIITPGLSVSVENNVVSEPVETRLDRIDSWRIGQYDYESVPLQQVLNEVKRLYSVEVEHDFSESELSSPITTTFKSLKDAAQTIALSKSRGFEVDTEAQRVVFKVK
ncbi:FecR domain-containing protein [Roseivirga sp. UBA1976]|uniref:FecR family protein n=1 Tax=Roseivirga sp. UBA1976 TaxID=1947386 RepID=UPI00257B9796|nr:FecR domain-containing protein [Roseivirga sp. UBA1976]|tara:strand:+ start:1820 stop:2764 length:945 start_codon:yes stop_codon:yes gene_type:complete